MPEVYYYVKTESVPNIVDCGLKLSTFYDKEVIIDGEKRLCFSGFLNPKDDFELYKSDSYRCLKLQIKSEKCFVADRFIYETTQGQDMELYYKTIIPIDEYMFGTYRLPECLITTTILAGEAVLIDKRIDSPILYSNCEELYKNNILQELRDNYAEIDDCLLYYFFDVLAELGKLDKIENSNKATTVFRGVDRTYCIKKPDLDRVF